MKYKLLQILLGAIGSAITVFLSHGVQIDPTVAAIAAMGVGSVTPLAVQA